MMPSASTNDTAVLRDTPSPLNNHVNNVKTRIPILNEMNLDGQNAPSNPLTNNLVPSIKNQVIGTPTNIKAILQSLAHCHITGPFTCIQTTAWPTMKNKAPYSMFL